MAMNDASTQLCAAPIASVDDANRVFGGLLGMNQVPVVLQPGRGCAPYITVPEGMYAIVQSNGADLPYPGTDSLVWPAGFHWAPPWVKVAYLVTKQTLIFDTPVKGCKTADDVTVIIDTCINLRIMGDSAKQEDPECVTKFIYRLGPTELGRQLKDAQEEAVRGLARSVRHTEVYGLRSQNPGTRANGDDEDDEDDDEEAAGGGTDAETKVNKTRLADDVDGLAVTEQMKYALNNQFNKYGVQITDVAITNVRLPNNFVKQMQDKTVTVSYIKEQQMKQEWDLQKVRYQEEIEQMTQEKKEERDAEEQTGRQTAASAQQALQTVRAETTKMVAQLREAGDAVLRQITADGELRVAELTMQKEALLADIQARGEAEAEALKADRDAFVWKKQAEADLTVAQNEARAFSTVSEAEGQAAPMLRSRREHEQRITQLSVYRKLSANRGLVISGHSGESLLADMLVSQEQGKVLLNMSVPDRVVNAAAAPRGESKS